MFDGLIDVYKKFLSLSLQLTQVHVYLTQPYTRRIENQGG